MAFIVWLFIIVSVYIALNKNDFDKEELGVATPFWVIVGILALALGIFQGLTG